MSEWFYDMGRRLGRAAVPALRKGKWLWNGLTGSEDDVRRAERELGAALAVEVRSVTQGSADERAVGLVRMVGERLAKAAESHGRAFRVEVLTMEPANAMALPGGFIFVSDTLVQLCEYETDETAFVVAHEMAHILLGHAWERVLNQGLFKAAAVVAGRAGVLGAWVRDKGLQSLQSAYARQGEFDADAEGRQLAVAAGFKGDGATRMLHRIERQQRGAQGLGRYFASHPPSSERIRRLSG